MRDGDVASLAGIPVVALALLAVAVLVGACVQGAVGLGIGLVAAPVAALVTPTLVPGLLIALAAVYPLFTLAREWRSADWAGLAWAVPARIPGTVLGVLVVRAVSDEVLGVCVGVVVLAAVVVTALATSVPVRPWTLSVAGLVSGLTGTATSIGGPPLALLYQRAEGPRLRATLAVYFTIGASMSLAGLAWGGQVDAQQLQVALLMLPVLALGALVAVPLRRRLDVGRTRSAVLAVCSVSAALLLGQSLLG